MLLSHHVLCCRRWCVFFRRAVNLIQKWLDLLCMMEKYFLGIFSSIFKRVGTSENICLKIWKSLLNSKFPRESFLSTLPNKGGWDVKTAKVVYVWIVFGQNTVIFQSLPLHCVMVACQIISLEKIIFPSEIGLPRVLEYINTYAEKQVWILTISYFYLGSGIQDQHHLPAFSLSLTETLFYINYLENWYFFLNNVSFLTMMLEYSVM